MVQTSRLIPSLSLSSGPPILIQNDFPNSFLQPSNTSHRSALRLQKEYIQELEGSKLTLYLQFMYKTHQNPLKTT